MLRNILGLLILLAGTGAGTPSSLAHAVLSAHNAVRLRASVAPLIWSDHLAQLSQDWADRLLAHKQFTHRPNSGYGENIYEITGADASPAEVVDLWAAESRNYDYASNRCRGVCGHYTQLVWAETREVGCAVARTGDREVWVCNYDPPGNVVGRRPY